MKFKVKYPVRTRNLEEVLNEIINTHGWSLWDVYPYSDKHFVIVYTVSDDEVVYT